MRRKSVIGLLTVMIIAVSFGGTAFGQIFIDPPPLYPDPTIYGPNLGAGQCAECDGKNYLGNLMVTETSSGQNQPTTETYIGPFDFDGEPWVIEDANGNVIHAAQFGPDAQYGTPVNSGGYCPTYVSENNKFLFDVCKCPEACVVAPGTRVGIEMIIDADGNFDTHDDGVYFADPDLDKVYFDINQVDLADNTYIWTDQHCTDNDNHEMGLLPDGVATRSFDEIQYYTSYTESKINSKGYYELNMGTRGDPIGGLRNTVIPAENRVVALQSDMEGGYVFRQDDTAKNCLFWIDIPPMRIDPTRTDEITGNVIRVRVRLLFNRQDVICPDCAPPDYCECVIEVARVGCDSPTGTGCMFIPYVLQGISDSVGWSSGVAVTARQDLPETPWCQLTLTDAAGNSAIYRNTAVTPIWTFSMDNELTKFTGDTLVPGAASLLIESNYSIDGYSYLDSGYFGAGVLPRGCGEGACAP